MTRGLPHDSNLGRKNKKISLEEFRPPSKTSFLPNKTAKRVAAKIAKVKVLAMDVDGVLTDATIRLDARGEETKIFNVYDGYGLAFFQRLGYRTVIISARSAGAVTARAADLKITKVFQDAYPKIGAYEQMKAELGVSDDQICFMGDDLPDLPVLERVGFKVSVPNAAAEVRAAADYVTKVPGGRGAVREIVELILKTQNRWDEVLGATGK